MKSLVVFESFYGNTAAVGRAIAGALERYGPTEIVVAGRAPAVVGDIDLLVVGAPTHAWGLPRRKTRPPDATEPEDTVLVREWLATLANSGRGRPALAFATRLAKPRVVTGTAATGIARRLHHRGWKRAAQPASFLVTGTGGPLREGELERAATWAASVARKLAGVSADAPVPGQ
jgi:hypothetical protein